jgi:hypothetical protein
LPEVSEYVARNPLNVAWPENSAALNEALGRRVQTVIGNRGSIKDAIAMGERTYNELRR